MLDLIGRLTPEQLQLCNYVRERFGVLAYIDTAMAAGGESDYFVNTPMDEQNIIRRLAVHFNAKI